MQSMLENHAKLDPAVQAYMFDRANNYNNRKEIDDSTKEDVKKAANEFRELCQTQFISMCTAKHTKRYGPDSSKLKATSEAQFSAWIRYVAGSSPEVNAQWLRMLEVLEEGNIVHSFKVNPKDGTVTAVKLVCSFSVFLNVLNFCYQSFSLNFEIHFQDPMDDDCIKWTSFLKYHSISQPDRLLILRQLTTGAISLYDFRLQCQQIWVRIQMKKNLIHVCYERGHCQEETEETFHVSCSFCFNVAIQ